MVRRRQKVVLWALLVAGLGLRVWYASNRSLFADEKYALRNVESLLEIHSLQPANVYYPSPVFFVPPAVLLTASEALHEATRRPGFAIESRGRLSHTAILLCRGLQVLYGTASLLLIHLLGRRLFSPRAALLGVAAVTFLPLHIRASAYYKPDAQLLLTVLIALLLSLRALRDDRWAGYALAGGAIGLAMSGKLLGGIAALPLVLGLSLLAQRDRRWKLTALTLAGASAAGTFVLLNPYWRHYLGWLHGLRLDYARRVDPAATTALEIPSRFVGSLYSEMVHGPWIATLALAGLLGLTVAAARAGRRSDESRERWLFLSFPLFFTTAYALTTPNFKANNFLSVLPFTALAAGWAIDRGGAVLASAGRARGRQWIGAVILGLCLATIVVPGTVFTYRSRIPTTRSAALGHLTHRLRPPLGRLLMAEATSEPPVAWKRPQQLGRDQIGLLEVDALASLGADRILAGDGYFFHESRLQDEDGEFYRRLMATPQGRGARTFRPSLFGLRGAPLVVVASPWRARTRTAPITAVWKAPEQHFVIPLPEGMAGGLPATLSLWVPRGLRANDPAWPQEVWIGDLRVPLDWVALKKRRHLFTSRRVLWPAGERAAIVQLRRPSGAMSDLEAVIAFWQPGR